MSKEMEKDEQSQLLSLIDEELTAYEELTVLLCQYVMPYVCKEPRKISEQTGYLWVQEIMEGHESQCYDMFRMEKHVFNSLCSKLVKHGLRNSKYIGVQEMVAMFLHTIGHGQCNRMIQERFQHSGETVSRLFHIVLKACLNLARENIKPRNSTFRECHPNIANDRRHWPFFKDAIGAIDSIHIPCVVSRHKQDKYIGRKGYPTQNVMAVCDWDMCFTFVLAGWEGIADDAQVFDSAISTPHMNFPHPPRGKYYLVDAGYPTPDGYLGPYKHERYHLIDFKRHPGFENDNEVFNYYHSRLRSTIERTFRVWKNRFQILKNMRKYDYSIQVRIVCATMAIHNFIRRNSQTDTDFIEAELETILDDEDDNEEDDNEEEDDDDDDEDGEVSSMNLVRDTIRDEIVLSNY